jgi:hypothetical protein
MSDLRPIGTEFEYTYSPCEYVTHPVFTTWRYRVVRHVETVQGRREVIEPVTNAVRIPAYRVIDEHGEVVWIRTE